MALLEVWHLGGWEGCMGRAVHQGQAAQGARRSSAWEAPCRVSPLQALQEVPTGDAGHSTLLVLRTAQEPGKENPPLHCAKY